jgi:hypothetical protein
MAEQQVHYVELSVKVVHGQDTPFDSRIRIPISNGEELNVDRYVTGWLQMMQSAVAVTKVDVP